MAQEAQLVMRRPHLDNLPEVGALPDGYALRTSEGGSDLPSLAATLTASFGVPWDEARVARDLTAATDIHAVYVVTHGGRVVGTASSRQPVPRFPGVGYVHWVGVDPAHQRRGLAAALMARVLHDFRERGYPAAVLETDDFRLPAIRAYLRCGFLPDYDVRGEDHRARWARVLAGVVGA